MVVYGYDINAILAEQIKKGMLQPPTMIFSMFTKYFSQEEATQKFTLWKILVLVT